MKYVTNGKQTYGVTDIQLSPFLQAGFRIVDSPIIQIPKIDAPVATKTPEEVTPEPFNETQEFEKQFTRTEVNRMPVAELKEVAVSLGLPVSEESTGAKLKSAILEKLKL